MSVSALAVSVAVGAGAGAGAAGAAADVAGAAAVVAGATAAFVVVVAEVPMANLVVQALASASKAASPMSRSKLVASGLVPQVEE